MWKLLVVAASVLAAARAFAQGSQNPSYVRKQQGNAPVSSHVSIAACPTATSVVPSEAANAATSTNRSIMFQCQGGQDCYVSTTNAPQSDGILLSHTSLMAVWFDSSARTAIYACGSGGTSVLGVVLER